MLEFISFLTNTILLIITVILSPLLYNAFYDQILFKKWKILYTSNEKKITDISSSTILLIKNIYEKNNRISKFKIVLISFILNLIYGLILYLNIEKNIMVSEKLYFFGMFIFITIGTIIMSFYEFHAYKLNIKILNNFLKNKNYFNLVFSFFIILFKISIIPFIFTILLFLEGSIFFQYIGTLLIYFSPLGSICFLFDYFIIIESKTKLFLLIPILSIISPIIFFTVITLFYKYLNKSFLNIIETIDSFVRKLHKNKIINEKTFNKIIVCTILFLQFSIFYISFFN